MYRYASGDCYEGDFVADRATGRGKYSKRNGDVYEGEYVNDKKHGYGTYCYASGEKYEGCYTEGKWSGLGQFWSVKGDVHVYNNGRLVGKTDSSQSSILATAAAAEVEAK